MDEFQKTIIKEASISGIGLHTGVPTTLTFKPAPAHSGIKFVRIDLEERPEVKANIEHVIETDRGTTISTDGIKIHTVEHVLASIVGLGIDNLILEVTSSEPPVGDGSSLPFTEALLEAGIAEQKETKDYYFIDRPVCHTEEDIQIIAIPSDEFSISFTIHYSNPFVGSQYIYLPGDPDTFINEIAPARTYCFEEDVEKLRGKGLIKGGSLENAIVISAKGILNKEPLRFSNEFVRHKIIDFLGDFALLGVPVRLRIVSVKSGHRSNVKFLRVLKKALKKLETSHLDIMRILDIMPHRYPFLLVDRILELQRNRVVGIKNVTMNEPFFQGHFPGHPIMPGVLIVEAMAQVGGFLLLHSVDNPENKLVYFLGIDDVRFRKPVRPGDQLRFELNMLKFKGMICKMEGHAYVEGNLVCEAQLLAKVIEK